MGFHSYTKERFCYGYDKEDGDNTEEGLVQSMPDPMVLIFMILVATYLLTFVVPAGNSHVLWWTVVLPLYLTHLLI